MKRVLKVEEEKDLMIYLKENTDYSNKKIKSMIEHDQIKVNNKRPRLPYSLKINDEVLITNDKVYSVPFSILYEDDKFLVVNKKCGLLTVATEKEKETTLYRQVYDYLHKKKEKVFVVHRLDKETSGIVLFAKSENVKNILQNNWNEIISSRKYVAIVHGILKKEGKIETYLKEEKNTFVHSDKNGKLAITLYCPMKSKGEFTLLDISLKTGRKNQIRVHMKENGHPVLGDKKYGVKDGASRLFLHSYELSFVYPLDHKKYQFSAPFPDDFLKIVS